MRVFKVTAFAFTLFVATGLLILSAVGCNQSKPEAQRVVAEITTEQERQVAKLKKLTEERQRERLRIDKENAERRARIPKLIEATRFVEIPSGDFTMGSSARAVSHDETPHHVTLTQGFEMSVCEVRQELYEAVMGNNPSRIKAPNHPVENVSWEEATDFCQRISVLEVSREAGHNFRLPTEAEWEYSCRAGTETEYHFGDEPTGLLNHAWVRDNSGDTTQAVGSKKPNSWGLFDMHGNVGEWCQDGFSLYEEGDAIDPTGPDMENAGSGSLRVARGGSYYYSLNSSQKFRAAFRSGFMQGEGNIYVGFRLVRETVETKEAVR